LFTATIHITSKSKAAADQALNKYKSPKQNVLELSIIPELKNSTKWFMNLRPLCGL